MEEPPPSERLTRLLQGWNQGDDQAATELFEAVYDELRRLARRQFGRERRDHTLQPTALVHEVYRRLVQQKDAHFEHRSDFYAAAVRLMRELLVDHARRHGAQKRGGGLRRVTLGDGLPARRAPLVDLLDLNRALDELDQEFPRQALIVELRCFADYSIEEVATVLDLSPSTVKRDWKIAQARLYRRLKPSSHSKSTRTRS